jgi:hypothetical protein
MVQISGDCNHMINDHMRNGLGLELLFLAAILIQPFENQSGFQMASENRFYF